MWATYYGLITGMFLDFLSALLWCCLAVGFLFIGWRGILLAGKIASTWKKRRVMRTTTSQTELPGVHAGGTIRAGTRATLMVLIGAVIGSGLTWILGHKQQRRYSYIDVLVLQRHDSTHYTLQPEWMKPWEMTTCTPQDWEQGEKMQFLNFKYHPGCDTVDDGAFVFYSGANGKRTNYLKGEQLNAGN